LKLPITPAPTIKIFISISLVIRPASGCARETVVFGATLIGQQDPERVDAEGRAERRMKQRDDPEHDRRYARPGLMLEQPPTDKNAASSNKEKGAADNRQHERGNGTANGFRGWDGDADNAADCHEDETRDNEERTSNNPEDAENAQVPIKTAG